MEPGYFGELGEAQQTWLELWFGPRFFYCANVRTTSGLFDTLTLTGRSSATYIRPLPSNSTTAGVSTSGSASTRTVVMTVAVSVSIPLDALGGALTAYQRVDLLSVAASVAPKCRL